MNCAHRSRCPPRGACRRGRRARVPSPRPLRQRLAPSASSKLSAFFQQRQRDRALALQRIPVDGVERRDLRAHVAIEVREEVADQLPAERDAAPRRVRVEGGGFVRVAQGVQRQDDSRCQARRADPLAGRAARAALRRSRRALRRKHAAGCTGRTGRSVRRHLGARLRPRRPRQGYGARPVRVRGLHVGRATFRSGRPGEGTQEVRLAAAARAPEKDEALASSSASRSAFSAAPFFPAEKFPAWAAEAARARAAAVASVLFHLGKAGRGHFD